MFVVSGNINLAYPFFYRPMFAIMEDGWQAFLPETEYGRLKSFSEEWRLSSINKNFEVFHYKKNFFLTDAQKRSGKGGGWNI